MGFDARQSDGTGGEAQSYSVTPEVQARIYQLWDELAAFEASAAPLARRHLLQTLCDLVDARNADWIGAVRMAGADKEDAIFGWRPRSFTVLNADPETLERISAAFDEMDMGDPDPTTTANVAEAGRFRVYLLSELAPEGWFEGRAYREYYAALDRMDSLWVGIPVNKEAEIQIGVHRGHGQEKFTETDRQIIGFALRGLSWFHRMQMLSEGIGIANAPLTATEQKVLQGLLQGLSEKAIALENGQSPHTTHDHVKRIFRKFGVTSRSELMALWLGRGPF